MANEAASRPEAQSSPTRSLRPAPNAAARMQEVLRGGTVALSELPPEETLQETMKEGNNEGSFLTSELPTKEENSEAPKVASEKVRKQSPKQSEKQPPKLTLKETVLEEPAEERVSKTRLNVDIDEELHFWLKGHAIQNRRKLNDLIPRILKAYRDEVEGEGE